MDDSAGNERPSKRARFFADDTVFAGSSSRVQPTDSFFKDSDWSKPPLPIENRPSVSDALNCPAVISLAQDSAPDPFNSKPTIRQQQRSKSQQARGRAPTAALAFDQETFEAFVGEKVRPDVLKIIRDDCGNNIERAINMYLDGTWKTRKRNHGISRDSSRPQTCAVNPPILPPSEKAMPDSRYVGAFGAEGWVTRGYPSVSLQYGDVILLDRLKNQAEKKVRGPLVQKQDILVRFTDSRGSEVGRLQKTTAQWVSTLIDQRISRFEGSVVYAPERLRTNDTILIQFRCFILKSAFEPRGLEQLADNGLTGIFEEKETAGEKRLRLRQIALVRLFEETNLLPSRGKAAAAKNQRQKLLEAAEKEEKERPKMHLKPLGRQDSSANSSEDEKEEGKELEQDQLDALYKKAQSFDFSTPEVEPADTFAMTLRPYQKQCLHWMIAREKGDKSRKEVSMHPLWEEYIWPTRDNEGNDLPQVAAQPAFYVNHYSGEMSLEFPVQEQHCLGGILADEMGLGKTIQMLSLVHSHRSEAAMQVRRSSSLTKPSMDRLPRLPLPGNGVAVDAAWTTLVVAPLSLLAQWQSEAEKASREGTLRTWVYYGSDKKTDLRAMCANAVYAPDVIVTSYGVVLSDYTQWTKVGGGDRSVTGGLFSVSFFRVILDEAHGIKNRQSKTARACYDIAATHRWVLTGTPIVNRLEDLFSLVRFLRVEPWSNFSFWRTLITVPFESGNFVRALDVVQTVLEPLVMRRTKDMETPDGSPLVVLPPKHVEILHVELSEAERAVYDHVHNCARRAFLANMEAGTVMKAYTSIFAQVLRLRQTCCHPLLVRSRESIDEDLDAGDAANAAAVATGLADDVDLQSLLKRFTAETDDPTDVNKFGAHVLKQIRDETETECPICAEEPMIDQAVTGCWHSACKKCLLNYIKHQTDKQETARCFQCREPIYASHVLEVVKYDGAEDKHDDDDDDDRPRPPIWLRRVGVNDSSAKISTLIAHLRNLRRTHPIMKTVVFSQFTSFLSLIEPALSKAKMDFLRLDGSMVQKARAAVLEEFSASNRFTILLLSLKAGGMGLNLTSAQRVYMMDPWWSFAVEAQAIDRVHRMGQGSEVRVWRLIVKDSVEERMLRVQERKKFLATSLGMMSDAEKKLARIEDIKLLLS